MRVGGESLIPRPDARHEARPPENRNCREECGQAEQGEYVERRATEPGPPRTLHPDETILTGRASSLESQISSVLLCHVFRRSAPLGSSKRNPSLLKQMDDRGKKSELMNEGSEAG